MALHDFQPLYNFYPALIAQMDPAFTSHEFILLLAQQHQVEYVNALHSYASSGNNQPFLQVHGQLANQLKQHPTLVRYIGDAKNSPNIFGDKQTCAQWERI